MIRLGYKVIIFGKVVSSGTEKFSSAQNAILTLRSRHLKDLPPQYEGCWEMIEITLK